MADNRTLALTTPVCLGNVGERAADEEIRASVVALYRDARPALVSYVRRLAGSGADAEDIVQSAFLRLFEQLSRRQTIDNLRAWIYRVVHNLAIDSLRRETRLADLARSGQWPAVASGTPPDERLIRNQQIASALARLNARERDCLLLRAEGLSYQEIADVLSTTSKSVSVYLARGLKKFRALS